jgi:acetate---CoA ligase (ADP-forming)
MLRGSRGGSAVDVARLAVLAARAGELLLAEGLTLVELNPVLARPDGAVAVDAVARQALELRH